MRQVAAALQRASELGIIHRDIKPENILLTRQGEVKVADFGLSRVQDEEQPTLHLTRTGITMGTPLYMSPEQVEGKPLDARTDIYSFGVTCYHMLAGHPPFQGENAFAVALQHVQGTPVPLETIRPDLPPALCAMVARMMAKKPEDRYLTANAILLELHQIAENAQHNLSFTLGQDLGISSDQFPALTPTVEVKPPVSPYARQRRFRLGTVLAAGLVLMIGGGGLLGWYVSRPQASDPGPTGIAPNSTRSERPADRAALPGAADAVLFVDPFKADEKNLLALIESNRNNPAGGQLYRLKLGLLYLSQIERDKADALGKANAFFEEQRSSGVREYVLIGQIGEALVLAFQDQARESLECFRKLNTQPSPPPRPLPGYSSPWMKVVEGNYELKVMVRKAMEYNLRNLNDRQRIPKDLQPFLLPPSRG
jgi:serine/threonine-protein kinase